MPPKRRRQDDASTKSASTNVHPLIQHQPHLLIQPQFDFQSQNDSHYGPGSACERNSAVGAAGNGRAESGTAQEIEHEIELVAVIDTVTTTEPHSNRCSESSARSGSGRSQSAITNRTGSEKKTSSTKRSDTASAQKQNLRLNAESSTRMSESTMSSSLENTPAMQRAGERGHAGAMRTENTSATSLKSPLLASTADRVCHRRADESAKAAKLSGSDSSDTPAPKLNDSNTPPDTNYNVNDNVAIEEAPTSPGGSSVSGEGSSTVWSVSNRVPSTNQSTQPLREVRDWGESSVSIGEGSNVTEINENRKSGNHDSEKSGNHSEKSGNHSERRGNHSERSGNLLQVPVAHTNTISMTGSGRAAEGAHASGNAFSTESSSAKSRSRGLGISNSQNDNVDTHRNINSPPLSLNIVSEAGAEGAGNAAYSRSDNTGANAVLSAVSVVSEVVHSPLRGQINSSGGLSPAHSIPRGSSNNADTTSVHNNRHSTNAGGNAATNSHTHAAETSDSNAHTNADANEANNATAAKKWYTAFLAPLSKKEWIIFACCMLYMSAVWIVFAFMGTEVHWSEGLSAYFQLAAIVLLSMNHLGG
jgi:hypothetical protein